MTPDFFLTGTAMSHAVSKQSKHIDAFNELCHSVASTTKNLPPPEQEEAILRATKASYRRAFDFDQHGEAVVVDEVLKSCEGTRGIKSYDELNAVYLFLAELIRVAKVQGELDALRGIRDRLFVLVQEEGGPTTIQMRPGACTIFHDFVNTLIQSPERVEDDVIFGVAMPDLRAATARLAGTRGTLARGLRARVG